jgi:hypothetical protein
MFEDSGIIAGYVAYQEWGLALAKIQIWFSSSDRHTRFSAANFVVADHGCFCPTCSAGTGERAQMALDWALSRGTRGCRGRRAGRLDNLLFWFGQWRDMENDGRRSCLEAYF